MTLIKYNPLNNFVPTTFGDLIENVLNDSANTNTSRFRPSVDIFKNEKQVEIELTAPGLTKEDFKIDLNNNKLVISGERKLDEERSKSYKKLESYFGQFSRSFTISNDIDQTNVSATYEAGILKVVLPFDEKKIKKTEIKVK